MVNRKEYHFISMDHQSELYGIACIPQGNIKGFLQILHDQKDYIDRYLEVMESLALSGYCVFGHDMIGHGKSVQHNNELGFMKYDKSHNIIVQDAHLMFLMVCQDLQEAILIHHKNANTPMLHVMLGMGFGACVARVYITQYQDVNTLILCGDKGFKKPSQKDTFACNRKLYQDKKDRIDITLDQALYRDYNRFVSEDSLNAWRTTSNVEQRKIDKDPKCNFSYSLHSIKSFMLLESVLDKKGWCECIPEYLPIFIISGYYDPISRYTRNIDQLLDELRRTSVHNVLYRYYDDARHELLFEKQRKEVLNDILCFIEKVHNQ